MKREHRPRPRNGRLQTFARRAKEFFTRDIWTMELSGLPTFRAMVYRLSRVVLLGGNGFVQDKCLFRASALTYITVLSLVPLLAFAFSLALQ